MANLSYHNKNNYFHIVTYQYSVKQWKSCICEELTWFQSD